jgi:tetratricopeptide (TPR) repeat protein
LYNLLLALAAGALSFLLVWAGLGPVAAVVPSLGVFLAAMFLLARRTGRMVERELATVPALLQQRRVDEAETKLVHVKEKYGPWQFLLAAQIDGQLGILDYVQRKFDEAVPKLEAGKWRNGPVLAMLGAVDWRRKRFDTAWKHFEAAVTATPEDPIPWAVYTTLLTREGKRNEALEVVARGVKALPKNAMLKELQSRVANKQKIETSRFGDNGEGWYQYFPEDLMQAAAMRGTRGAPFPGMPQPPQPRFGAKHAPRR